MERWRNGRRAGFKIQWIFVRVRLPLSPPINHNVMKIIGIDPGLHGGIAVYDAENGNIKVYKMPETFPDIFNLLTQINNENGGNQNLVAYLEDVGQGIPNQSSSATAKFARHNGHLEMALYAIGIRTEMVKPQKWQKSFSNTLGKSSDYEKREWKNRLKALAQRLFPQEKVTLDTADAILISYYGSKQ